MSSDNNNSLIFCSRSFPPSFELRHTIHTLGTIIALTAIDINMILILLQHVYLKKCCAQLL